MDKEGLEAIYRSIAKTKIKEVNIISGKGTEVTIVRCDEEIKKSNQSTQKADRGKKETGITISSDTIDSESNNRFDIVAPEVGFFNRYNVKSKQQFFKLRDLVKKGEVVATVVSLHNHYSVIAPASGKIIEFLVEHDQPVAYGQPLIRLEKTE